MANLTALSADATAAITKQVQDALSGGGIIQDVEKYICANQTAVVNFIKDVLSLPIPLVGNDAAIAVAAAVQLALSIGCPAPAAGAPGAGI